MRPLAGNSEAIARKMNKIYIAFCNRPLQYEKCRRFTTIDVGSRMYVDVMASVVKL